MKGLCTVLLFVAVSLPAAACLWDNDTLQEEHRGMPEMANLLAGKWERHSEFFYRQRAEKMRAAIAANPKDLAAYDNLAVAHEKLDDQDGAIAVMLEKEKIKPGEYTTYANLGTFYLHKGDFENGVAYIRKALAINPNAHFGREEYQLKLAEYYLAAKGNPELLKTKNFLGLALDEIPAVAMRHDPERLATVGLKPNVVDGITGMIRFGTGKSAELYFVLGDLLALQGDKKLAYRSYRRALDLNHPRADHIRARMKQIMDLVEDHSEFDPALIARERADAEAWVRAYQAYEDELVRAGKDTEDVAVYEAFYKSHGRPRPHQEFNWRTHLPRTEVLLFGALVTFLLLSVVAHTVRKRRRARRA